jgi:GT2 family glycosyltransferase
LTEPLVPRVSVVLLSHNRPHMVGRALASIVGQSLQDREIIVVDNRSDTSDQIARIVATFPGVHLIQSESNIGFTGGMNLGLHHSRGQYIFFTEDDIVAEQNSLQLLEGYATSHPGTGLLTGLLLDGGNGTILAAGGEVSLGPPYHLKIFGAGEPEHGQFFQPFEVSFVSGSVIFAPRQLIAQLGGFRQYMFIYSEDVDLCLRVAKRGYGITVLPAARFTHLPGSLGPPSEFVEFHKIKNFLSLYILHAPAWALPIAAFRYGLLSGGRALLQDRRRALLLAKAWFWVLAHLRQLLEDRTNR